MSSANGQVVRGAASGEVPGPDASGIAPTAAAPGLTILIVEDNEDAAASLADLLALGGHRVSIASTGSAGVSKALAEAPRVLICDVGLPDMSGHEVVRTIRAGERHRSFAIALTGYAQPSDRDEALAAGFDAHLCKPPPLEELEDLLSEATSRSAE